MSMNSTPSASRVHIAFFGRRNAGKSSLVNAVTNQKMSVVSEIAGTTTDPVNKSMELLPIGPVVITDTPGIDDSGALGELRVKRAEQVLSRTDAAVLVVDGTGYEGEFEKELEELFLKKKIPYIKVYTKSDDKSFIKREGLCVSSVTQTGIHELKEALAQLLKNDEPEPVIISDILNKNDYVVLVVPIDSSAPKGRLILPQQQVIRDALEAGAIPVVTRETELESALANLSKPPAFVVTDSQVFDIAAKKTPTNIPLTSFSILMARFKGFLETAVNGAMTIDLLNNGDKILISEGCTHHRQCEDIGTVKLPNWIKKYTGKNINIEFSSGMDFPETLTQYSLIIHCGGCMLNSREVMSRMERAKEHGVPFTNYGTAIAKMKGILDRSIKDIPMTK